MRDVDADVVVIGSGPAGAQAAKKLVELGLRVWTIDVGQFDPSVADAIPTGAFTQLRRTDLQQARYFVGDINESNVLEVKAGAQLTPPRAYITHLTELHAPLVSGTFHPMLSLALGGLGAAWGSGSFTFTRAECERAGLSHETLAPAYREVAADIGISGAATDDIAGNMADLEPLQPPQPLDDNARSIFDRYSQRRELLRRQGFRLGRPPIAMLSRSLDRNGEHREANPLFDMDFYSDASRSVYRPRFTIEALQHRPGYRYIPGLLALSFNEADDGVELVCQDLRNDSHIKIFSRRLVVAAGALNSARIVARSLGAYGRRLPLLCNPYRYVPALNLAMLGRASRDRRHSLVQLVGTLSKGVDDPEQTFISVYSYRSLLLHKLVKEMPLPPVLGLLAARLIVSSLAVLGVHFPESATDKKWLALERGQTPDRDRLQGAYASTPVENAALSKSLVDLFRVMLSLRLLPMGVVDPGNGSSIHYAGPLGFRVTPNDLATAPDGHLYASPRVYVGDSASWTFLPAKGPTLTIMAHARTVAAEAARSLV